MRVWFIRQLLQALTRLTSYVDNIVIDTATEKWLAEAWLNKAAVGYFTQREKKLRDHLSNGSGSKPEPRDSYLIAYGQLLEARLTKAHMEACYSTYSKKKKT